jgi:hypothetical protein
MRSCCIDSIAQIQPARSARVSSWDRTGGNNDCIRIEPGETRVLADLKGPGAITHIYFTIVEPNPLDYRDALLRMYWDDEETPSVEVPFGDFFCISNCTVRRFASLMMAVNRGGGAHTINNGLNCYFPMPFSRSARIELVNQTNRIFGGAFGRVWYHIDYERHDAPLAEDLGRFHAQWRRENLTTSYNAPQIGRGVCPSINLSDGENYCILEAQGEGHVAGLFLQVDNVQGGWYGEGDDMIFIDGERWPPSLHGTGTEEVFGGGACPDREYAGPYTGFLLVENLGGETFKGKNAMYRWYVRDPIRFRKSVRMSIEHGHANDCENDYASVAYWYQKEPHAPFPALPDIPARRPIFPESYYAAVTRFSSLCDMFVDYQDRFLFENTRPPEWLSPLREKTNAACELLYTGEYDRAAELLEEICKTARKQGYPLQEK